MPAKKDINLLKKRGFDQKPLGITLHWALTYGRYIIICTEIIVLLAFISRFKFDRDLIDLREKISQQQTIVENSQVFEREVRSIQNHLAQIKAGKNDQQKIVALMRYIETITPPDVFFDDLTLDEKRLTLSTKALSSGSVTTFINNVRLSPLFTDVRVDTLEQKGGEPTIFHLQAYIAQSQ